MMMKKIVGVLPTAGYTALAAQTLLWLKELAGVVPFVTESAIFRSALLLTIILVTLAICGVPVAYWFAQSPPSTGRRIKQAFISIGFIMFILVLTVPASIRRFITTARDCKSCDYKIAGFDLKKGLLTDADIQKLFGVGCYETSPQGLSSDRSYYSPDRGIFAKFTVAQTYSEILVSAEVQRDCPAPHHAIPTETGLGLKLGDNMATVSRIYGRPREAVERGEGVIEVLYSKDFNAIFIRLGNDKVTSIRVAARPD